MKQLLQADQLVTMLAEATGRKLSPEGLMAYEIALNDVPLSELNRAAIQLLRSSKFMPSAAEIREAAGAVSGNVAVKDKPTLAWCDVRRAISHVGGYDSPSFSDPVINATIREMGGWVLLCESTVEELVWREKDFLRMYAALSTCILADERTARLAGVTEKENGTALPAPVAYVGCLTTGGEGHVVQRLESNTVRPVEAPHVATEQLAKRLAFDDRSTKQTQTKPTPKSREGSLADLRQWYEQRKARA